MSTACQENFQAWAKDRSTDLIEPYLNEYVASNTQHVRLWDPVPVLSSLKSDVVCPSREICLRTYCVVLNMRASALSPQNDTESQI